MNHALLIHFCTTSFLFSGPNRAYPLCILSSARDGARFGSRVHDVLALFPWSDSVQHIESPSFEHNFIPMTVLPSFLSLMFIISIPGKREALESPLPGHGLSASFPFRCILFIYKNFRFALFVFCFRSRFISRRLPMVAICVHSVFFVLRPQDSQRCMCIHRK